MNPAPKSRNPKAPLVWGVILLLAACAGPPPPTPVPLAVDFIDPNRQAQLCAQVDANWDHDWEQVIAALETLVVHQTDCAPDQPSAGKLYAAYFNYGAFWEASGVSEAALPLYYAALEMRPDGREALAGLARLNAPTPTPPPLSKCDPLEVQAARQALPPYHPSPTTEFVVIQERGFAAGGIAFVPRGVNYFPMRSPWRRFLTEADLEAVRMELALLRETGFNSLRIFLWNEALFQCPADGAVPNPAAFARLDALLSEAAALGFRLIVTLNDLPDLTLYPLYTNPDHIQQQTAFIIERYKDEAAIMAWDLRNEGDIDARTSPQTIPQAMLLTWLGETAALVRRLDPQHLITAGWLRDELSTAPYVDFLSFHYWNSPDQLEARIKPTLENTEKPVLMEEFGYSTFNLPPETQRDFLNETITLAEEMGIAGWLIWTAFDFPLEATCLPPACPSADNDEHHFGLWQADYSPKPAVEILRQRLR